MIAASKTIIDRISRSETFREYGEAFRNATGLPLEITEVNQVKFALCSKSHGNNAFCQLMSESGYRCDTCRLLNANITEALGIQKDEDFSERMRQQIGLTEKSPQTVSSIRENTWTGPKTFECFAGLCESLVPIRAEGQTVGFLKTGQVLLHEPTHEAFQQAIDKIEEMAPRKLDSTLEKSYFQTPVLSPDRYEAMVMLLKSFSDQLAEMARKLLIEIEHSEPVMIRKAKACIQDRFCEPVDLEEIAHCASVSPFHLSRKFKEVTGMGIAEYLNRVRIDHAKDRLMQKDVSIAEVAFLVGFQSLAPFNKAFRRYSGMTPKQYRNAHQN